VVIVLVLLEMDARWVSCLDISSNRDELVLFPGLERESAHCQMGVVKPNGINTDIQFDLRGCQVCPSIYMPQTELTPL
jgi:hypothetical protein